MPPTATAARRCSTPTVAEGMITDVKVSGTDATVGTIRALFADRHVHAAVIVEAGALMAVIERADLADDHDDDELAVRRGHCRSRVIAPDVELETARQLMLASGRRRLAVVDADGRLLGLLCLKRTRRGFCSDDDTRNRAADRRAAGTF